ncbi:MAG: type IV secretion system protein [Burkholderiales bacterium]|nr:type IV secretion system protein [Burkholderiales bacterium]
MIEEKLKTMIGNQKITSIGWELFWFFGAANVIYILIRSMLTSGGLHDVVADLIPLGIMAGVVFAFLTRDVGQQIQATMETLGEAITGQRTGALGPLMVQAAATSMETIANIWKVSPTPASPTSNASALISLTTFLPNTIMTVLATVVSVLLVVGALAIYMAHLVTSQISMYIALMFAPFFVPFLLFRPASWLFEGWLRFFVGSLLLKIVGLILLTITSSIMAAILDLSKSVGGPGMSAVDAYVFDMTKYSVIIMMAALGKVCTTPIATRVWVCDFR